MNPRFGGRQWVKLWVNEWLDGTTRFEMTDAQRAFWIDLLAMAGRSRFPGTICAGQVDGKYVGYPLNRFQSLLSEPLDVEETLKLFERTGKIRIETTAETPIRLLKVELVNWNRYQSEYQRQKKYRKRLQRSDPKSDNQSNTTEGEGEGEGEGEERIIRLSDDDELRLSEAFPGVSILGEKLRAESWLKENPEKRYKSLKNFFRGWIGRSHRELLKTEVAARAREIERENGGSNEARVGLGPTARLRAGSRS